MAFNIMDLFGPSAINRLLQPLQNTGGVQNFLANPQAAGQGFDPARFAGTTDRLPAVGMDALRERLGSLPMQGEGMAGMGAGLGASGQAPQNLANSAGVGVGASASGQAMAQNDPWAGLREVTPIDRMQTAGTAKQPSAGLFGGGIDAQALNDLFTGWAMGSTPSESMSKGALLVAQNRGTRNPC